MDRRSFLRGGLALVAAPAIVRASSLMPIKAYGVDFSVRGGPTLPVEHFLRIVADAANVPLRMLTGPPVISPEEKRRAEEFFSAITAPIHIAPYPGRLRSIATG